MYYQNYEEYLSQMQRPQIPYSYYMLPTYIPEQKSNDEDMKRSVEELYPDLYRRVYPVVCKVCSRNTRPLDSDVLEELTSEVFVQLESGRAETSLDGSVKLEVRSTAQSNTTLKQREEKISSPRQSRQRNPILHDLIRILIIREILGGINNKPNHPCPPRPPRPCQMPYCNPQGHRPPYPFARWTIWTNA